MPKINIKFGISFIIFLIIAIFLNFYKELVIYLFVLFLHEYVHSFVAYKLGYKLNNMLFMPYGASVFGNNIIISAKNECIIAISAPLVNILTSIVLLAVWWVFPSVYFITYDFMFANLSLGLFNLIPVFPLDGGRVLLSKYKNSNMKKVVFRILMFNSILFAVGFVALFVKSIFYRINYSYLFIAFFLILSITDYKSENFYNKTYIEKDYKSISTLPLKCFVVSNKLSPNALVKYLNIDNFIVFLVIDQNGKIIKTITECDLLNILKKTEKIRR